MTIDKGLIFYIWLKDEEYANVYCTAIVQLMHNILDPSDLGQSKTGFETVNFRPKSSQLCAASKDDIPIYFTFIIAILALIGQLKAATVVATLQMVTRHRRLDPGPYHDQQPECPVRQDV